MSELKPIEPNGRCPKCKHHVIQKAGSGVSVRVKGRMELQAGGCATQCYWCGEGVFVPLELSKSFHIPEPETPVTIRQPEVEVVRLRLRSRAG